MGFVSKAVRAVCEGILAQSLLAAIELQVGGRVDDAEDLARLGLDPVLSSDRKLFEVSACAIKSVFVGPLSFAKKSFT